VYLDKDERKALKCVAREDGYSGQIRTRANILLALDESGSGAAEQADIADVLKTSTSTIYNVSRIYSEGGLDAVLTRKKRMTPPVPAKLTGEVEARVIRIACSNPPEGYTRWSLRLLEDKIIALDDLPNLSDNTIGRLLKKHRLSLT
jgi:transposase